ncbi:hypothetical protein TVAG_198750 [Trichomonas vaginalis G3]|uniref:Uncharacterized protein n=1 Tax=Trichomonas vaginalis (strain ATCC PRA-98 / G3) TaxID=412133 RepID=A2DDR0_TRIV3|nr:hypothetical protein TVAGG3_0999180 [Trichomonas vaginalis G3]EAY21436.1 hypothetical protein TVAG_198750 [Trichomonas vaginalis G3]KAI5490649.1 hypothetical protein TVAGG3_0999180 [Trichomonas vaginalis G3]|eukprot:XP_001582422.1 hypothetical protein [Trichomonas vaginalis G3]
MKRTAEPTPTKLSNLFDSSDSSASSSRAQSPARHASPMIKAKNNTRNKNVCVRIFSSDFCKGFFTILFLVFAILVGLIIYRKYTHEIPICSCDDNTKENISKCFNIYEGLDGNCYEKLDFNTEISFATGSLVLVGIIIMTIKMFC